MKNRKKRLPAVAMAVVLSATSSVGPVIPVLAEESHTSAVVEDQAETLSEAAAPEEHQEEEVQNPEVSSEEAADETVSGSTSEGTADGTVSENASEGTTDETTSGNASEGTADETVSGNVSGGTADGTDSGNASEGTADGTASGNASEGTADETVSGDVSEGTADEMASGNVSEEEKPAEGVLTETEEGPAGEIPEEKPSDDAIAPTEEKVSPLEEALSGVLEDAALLEVKPEIPIDAEALADAEDENVKINAENFPDSDFRGYLYKYCDSNKDMQLSPEEIQKITSIDVSRRNLASLEGIAYFPYLKTLSCVGTKITELDVSRNPALESINLNNTGVTELDVSQNPALKTLLMDGTGITSIDISQNPALTRMTCVNGKLKELDISHNSELGALSLAGTDITELDVSQNEKLRELYVQNTKLTELNVSQNPALTSLNIENTDIAALDVSQNPNLGTLYANGSKLDSLDVSGNPLLTNLQCSNTNISELDVSQNPKLTRLHCDDTKLIGIDVSKNTALTAGHFSTDLAWLNVGENAKLSDLTMKDSVIDIGEVRKAFSLLEKFPGIDLEKIISIEGAELDKTTGAVSNYESGTPIVYTYDCGTGKKGNAVLTVTLNFTKNENIAINAENFPDSDFRGYLYKYCDSNKDMQLSPEEIQKITSIDVSRRNLASLEGIAYFPYLKTLSCVGTKITELDVSRNPALESINLNNTGVTELDVSQNPALKTLLMDGTGITSIDISQNPALTRMTCVNGKLTELDISHNSELGALSLAGTDITELDVSQNEKLRELYVQNTKLTELNVSKNPALTSLNIENTDIAALDVSQNPNLGTLYANGSKLDSLDVSSNPLLTNLQCSNTNISELDVSQNPKLTRLHCDDTKLIGIDVSKNTALTAGHFSTDLAWLNVGENAKLSDLTMKDSVIDIGEVRKAFSLLEKFPGIDLEKITSIEGAELDKATGVVSNYESGTPIVYTYDCGTSKKGNAVLTVTLNFTKNENIAINAENFPDSDFRGYLYKYCDSNKDMQLSPEEIQKITSIDVSRRNLASLEGIAYFPYLKTLSCVGTKITELDVSRNPALESINLNNTGVTELDVSQNPALKTLLMDGTGITSIDISQNPALTRMTCVNGKLKELDISHNSELGALSLAGTDITELDVSQNEKLRELYVQNTKLTELNVSKNPALTSLNIENTDIAALDVSQNPNLGTLYANGSKLDSLDVSGNPLLTNLQCSSTNISELDVSQNPKLTRLHCDDTKLIGIDVSKNTALTAGHFSTDLAWLNVGENAKLSDLTMKDSVIDIGKLGSTFDLTEKFPGINPDRIVSIEGAELDKATGVVSNYESGTPIVYTYDCGTSKKGNVILTVTLNFTAKEESTLSFDGELSKTYDGTPVEKPENLIQTGSTDTPVFEWYEKDGEDWTKLDAAPVNAGSYKLTVTVAEDADYMGVSISREFEIAKAESTVTIDALLDKTYDGQAVKAPEKIGQTGSTAKAETVWYAKDGEGWTKLNAAPVNAGSYKAVVTVAENENYKGASAEKGFTIAKAESTVTIDASLDKTYDGQAVKAPEKIGQTGSTAKAETVWYAKDGEGWTKLNAAPVNAGSYKAVVTVAEDENHKGASAEKGFTIAKAESTIALTGKLDKKYDGKPVGTLGGIKQTGSTSKPSFTWYAKDGKNWKKLDSAPVNAGNYKVMASVAEDENHTKAEASLTFKISAKKISSAGVPKIKDKDDLKHLVIKDGNKTLKEGTDYVVTVKEDGDTTKVTIQFTGNYSGTVKQSYTSGGSSKSKHHHSSSGSSSNTGDSSAAASEQQGVTSPATGDTAAVGLWASIAALSTGMIAALKKRKKKTSEE